MAKIIYKDLYTLTVAEIERRLRYSTSSTYDDQLSRTDIAMGSNVRGDVDTSLLINTIMDLLETVIPQQIIEGLEVIAKEPFSPKIIIKSGKGTVGGRLYELDEDTEMTIPFNSTDPIFYVILYRGGVQIAHECLEGQLKIAKIVIPLPGTTIYVQDQKDDSINAYIINYREYKLYGYNDHFEEETVELLRDNISPILSDNLIGNIRLSEDLKITNTQGSMEMDSDSISFLSPTGTELARFDINGTFFYANDGRELARFSVDGAHLGHIQILPNGIQSDNYVSGYLGQGFKIASSGDAEFSNVIVRGRLSSSVFVKDTISAVGGNLLVADAATLKVPITRISSIFGYMCLSEGHDWQSGDILRIKDGNDDEWLCVFVPVCSDYYWVKRDKGCQYEVCNPSNWRCNPEWPKGSAVVNYGGIDKGLVYMTSSECNAPYMSVVTHGCTPWCCMDTRVRIGNLNGYLGYETDSYGIGIGDSDAYLKYDPDGGLQIKGSITITGGNASVSFYQADAPVIGMKTGDYWIDTNDNNAIYIYQDNNWVAISANSEGTGILTFRQSQTESGWGIPTSINIGDLWIDTDDDSMYRANMVGANEIRTGEWVLVSLSTISLQTFAQGNIPTSTTEGDLWIDTSNGNKMYRAYDAGVNTISPTGWVLISDSNKIVTFRQDGTPTSLNIGDLWIDTDGGNLLYYAASIGADDITAGEWILATDSNKSKTFYSATPPTSINEGDLWVDTDDGNKLYRAYAVGVSTTGYHLWEEISDGNKTTTFAQEAVPTSRAIGDLWVNTTNGAGNPLYRAAMVGANEIKGGEWVLVTSSNKTTTFAQDEPPTSLWEGDIWIDTNDKNKMYRAKKLGSYRIQPDEWVLVRDTEITEAMDDAANAQTTANEAADAAAAAQAELDDIANDDKLTPLEKIQAKQLWDSIVLEATPTTGTIIVQADASHFNVSSTAFASAYSTLNSYLNTVLASLTTTTDISRSTWDTNWKNYYAARTDLLNAIATKAKAEALLRTSTFVQSSSPIPTSKAIGDIWINTSDTNKMYVAAMIGANEIKAGEWVVYTNTDIALAISNAATAQSTANGAVSSLNDIASDSKLTPDEKISAKQRWNVVVTEGTATTGTIPAQAIIFSVDHSAFDTAYSTLNSYLATPLGNLTTTSDIVRATWNTNWENYYNARTALLNAIATKARAEALLKTTTFVQASIPTSKAIGDIWINTTTLTGENKMYVAESIGATAITTGQWVLRRDLYIQVAWDLADAAQTTAEAAQSSATSAISSLAEIASDTKITPIEKLTIKPMWELIITEATLVTGTIPVQAALFGVDDSAFDAAYLALYQYIVNTTAVFVNTATTTTIVRLTWDGKWKDYYNARTALLNAIAAKARAEAIVRNRTFYQSTPPTAITIGDLWIDTDDNKLYRASATGNANWVAVQDIGISSAISIASGAQTTANTKVTTFFIANPPTAIPTSISTGDLWINTYNNLNKLYRASGVGVNTVATPPSTTGWVQIQDADIATAIAAAQNAQDTADDKIASFYQDSAPTTGMSEGDFWIDTNDGNKIYNYRGSTWVEVGPAVASSGITVFRQSPTITGIPTSLKQYDLWMNLDNGRLYRAAIVGANEMIPGEWEEQMTNIGSTPSIGAGLYMSADYMGYYNGSCWQNYMDNIGNFYFKGSASNYLCWNGSTLTIRGSLNACDITAGNLQLSGAMQVSSATTNNKTTFSAYGLRSYNASNVMALQICDGHIEAQDIKLVDPACSSCYSFLDAGKLKFHDPLGDVPYVTRICSGSCLTGTKICLLGWNYTPELTLGIKDLMAYNSAYPATSQVWHVYADNIDCFYCNASCYGQCFTIHASLTTAAGSGTETNKNLIWCSCTTTGAGTCSTRVKMEFQLWCTTAPTSAYYYYGTICYAIRFRCYGCSGGWEGECTYSYVQPHATCGQITAPGEICHTIIFPSSKCWELSPCQVGSVSYTNSGFCSSNPVTYCCICDVSHFFCSYWAPGVISQKICQRYSYQTITPPANTYCTVLTGCVVDWQCAVYQLKCWCHAGDIYVNGAYQTLGQGVHSTCCNFDITCCYTYNCSFSTSVTCFRLFEYIDTYVKVAGYTYGCVAVSGNTRYCYTVQCQQGTAVSCCTTCLRTILDTYSTQTILDPGDGVINWLAISYN